MREVSGIWIGALLGLTVSGCTPQWHSGRESHPLVHHVEQAYVFKDRPDALSVVGSISPYYMPYAVTDYGLKVSQTVDDTGKKLALRSFQIFWMKGMCFEAEFDPPAASAKAVSIDFVFTSRSGVQRIAKTLSIERDCQPSYVTQSHRWTPGPYNPDLSKPR